MEIKKKAKSYAQTMMKELNEMYDGKYKSPMQLPKEEKKKFFNHMDKIWKSKKESTLEEKVATLVREKLAEQEKEALFGKWKKVELNDTLRGSDNKATTKRIDNLFKKNKVDIKSSDSPRRDGSVFFYDYGSGGKEKAVVQLNGKGTVFVNKNYKDIRPEAIKEILENNTVERSLSDDKVVDKDLINIKQWQKVKTNDVLSLQKNKLSTVMQRVDKILKKRYFKPSDKKFDDSTVYADWEDDGLTVVSVSKNGIKVNKKHKDWNYIKNDLEKARSSDLRLKEDEEEAA